MDVPLLELLLRSLTNLSEYIDIEFTYEIIESSARAFRISGVAA
jgi:hypothetical protein